MDEKIIQNVDKDIFLEIPTITTSSPSIENTDTESSRIHKNVMKLTLNIHSDEEIETSFVENYDNNNHRVSFLRSLSPSTLNSTNASKGVNKLNTQAH